MRAFAPLVLGCFALTGCASLIGSITDRPITSDNLQKPPMAKLKSMSGDRRLLRIEGDAPDQYHYIVCAETQADAIASRSVNSGITGKYTGGIEAVVTDAVTQSLMQTYKRTGRSDLFRQASWQLCNSYANQVIDADDYKNELFKLIDAAALRVGEPDTPPTPSAPQVEPAAITAAKAPATPAAVAKKVAPSKPKKTRRHKR